MFLLIWRASPIDYSWITYKPVLEENLLSDEASNNKNSNYTIDKDSLFSIAPKQGTLDRNEIKMFEIMFSPNKVYNKNFLEIFFIEQNLKIYNFRLDHTAVLPI